MININISQYSNGLYDDIINILQAYGPKVIGALLILVVGILISILVHKLIIYVFKRFRIIALIDKLNIDISPPEEKSEKNEKKQEILTKKISDTIKVDEITAKAMSYYIFLVFFRLSITAIGIDEIESFMDELLAYLPSLFIAVIIWFFGIRFANFIYDLVYHALDLSKQKTAKIVASGAKVIILFFTLMAVLSKIWIAEQITQTILTGFIGMLALAWGLAFGLGWKEVAKEILESFRK